MGRGTPRSQRGGPVVIRIRDPEMAGEVDVPHRWDPARRVRTWPSPISTEAVIALPATVVSLRSLRRPAGCDLRPISDEDVPAAVDSHAETAPPALRSSRPRPPPCSSRASNRANQPTVRIDAPTRLSQGQGNVDVPSPSSARQRAAVWWRSRREHPLRMGAKTRHPRRYDQAGRRLDLGCGRPVSAIYDHSVVLWATATYHQETCVQRRSASPANPRRQSGDLVCTGGAVDTRDDIGSGDQEAPATSNCAPPSESEHSAPAGARRCLRDYRFPPGRDVAQRRRAERVFPRPRSALRARNSRRRDSAGTGLR